jgi:hypothetical protein
VVGVPYWWNRSSDSLAATISKFRPDLIPHVCRGKKKKKKRGGGFINSKGMKHKKREQKEKKKNNMT